MNLYRVLRLSQAFIVVAALVVGACVEVRWRSDDRGDVVRSDVSSNITVGDHLGDVLWALDRLGYSHDSAPEETYIIIPEGRIAGRILYGHTKLPETEEYCERVVSMYFVFSQNDILENYYVLVTGDVCYK